MTLSSPSQLNRQSELLIIYSGARFAKTITQLNCFHSRPVRSIIKRATAMEYKLHRLIVKKEDFIAYVQVK